MNFSHFLPIKTTAVQSRWSSWISRTCYATTLVFGLGAGLLISGSCANDVNMLDTPQSVVVDTANCDVLSFGFSLLKEAKAVRSARDTRATESANEFVNGGLNETKINNMYALFYEGDTQRGMQSTVKGDLMLYPQGNTNPLGVTTADALQGEARVFVKKNGNPYQGKNLRMVIIVNFHGSLTDLQGKRYSELQNLVSSGTNVLGAQNNPAEKQADFLMDGAANVQTYRWNNNQREIAVSGTIALSRAAVKLRVRLAPPTNIRGNAGENFTVVGNPQIAMVNGVNNTRVLSATMLESGRNYINNGQTNFQDMGKRRFGGAEFFARPIPFYTYPNAWGNDVNNETHLLIKLRLRANGRDKDSYYKIPLKNVLPSGNSTVETWNRLVRNTVYDIQTSITAEGSSEASNPVTLQSSIAVENWTATDPVDGNIAEAHYLVVTQTNPEMRATDELEIQYISDVPLDEATLRVVDAEYKTYDKEGNESTVKADKSKIAISLTSHDGRTFIKVKSPVPINYVPLTIRFTAKQQDTNVLSPVPITVTQYPPIYVTAKISEGIRTYWYSAFGARVGNSVIRNGLLYTVHTIVPQTGMLMGDAASSDGSTKKDAESNQLISPEFIIASQWSNSQPAPQSGEYTNDEIKNGVAREHFVLREIEKLESRSGGLSRAERIALGNYYSERGRFRFWIRTSYFGQDANLRPEQRTLVAVSPLDDRGNRLFTADRFAPYRVRVYKSAEQLAKKYYEDQFGPGGLHQIVGMDEPTMRKYNAPWPLRADQVVYYVVSDAFPYLNSKGEIIPYHGSWRLPTTAELQLVSKIQNDPNSAVKHLLPYPNAWAAQNGVIVNTSNGQTTTGPAAFALPIFDSYKYK